MENFPTKIDISPSDKRSTRILVNGIDISHFVTHFSLEQHGGEPIPTLKVDIPGYVEFYGKGILNIERV